jgi:hypothetical protein
MLQSAFRPRAEVALCICGVFGVGGHYPMAAIQIANQRDSGHR